MKPQLIDIHSHILPFTDDGADDWESAIEMLKNAEEEGIRAIVATPHVLSEHHFKDEKEIIKTFQELVKRAKKERLKIKLFLSCEIYAQPDTSLNHRIATLNNNGKYFLMEFPMTSVPRFVPDMLFDFIVDEKIPIIAHPERNAGFQSRPDLIFEYIQRGSLMQMNEGSLRGRFGDMAKNLAFKMIENNLVHFIASDGHKVDRRTVTLIESYEMVKDKYGKKTAIKLFSENPLKAIQGEKIDIGEPQPIEEEVKVGLWSKIRNLNRR